MLSGVAALHSTEVERGFSTEKERRWDHSDLCKLELNKHCLATSVCISTVNGAVPFLSDFSLPYMASAEC